MQKIRESDAKLTMLAAGDHNRLLGDLLAAERGRTPATPKPAAS